MGVSIKNKRTRIALTLRIVCVSGILLTYCVISFIGYQTNGDATRSQLHGKINPSNRHILAIEDELGRNCTPPAIEEFPSDGFTRAQRKNGWVLLHVILATYLFTLLAIVCDDYFVPAIKVMCNSLRMAEDVAGATFMAAASSSPELFINCVGTFITKGDLGVGTVVGSAVFNVLAVPACCGLFAGQVVKLDWWPVSRDSLMYGASVIALIFVLDDGKIEVVEAFALVAAYMLYIGAMYFNDEVSHLAHWLLKSCRKRSAYKDVTEIRPLLKSDPKFGSTLAVPIIAAEEVYIDTFNNDDLEESTDIWNLPDGSVSVGGKIFWVLTWPISFLLYCTIPDCSKHRKLVALTFAMCIFWIGSVSYVVAWIITIVGDTLEIPDSIVGLTFLAAGTSVPEAVSSVIVTNQGHGAMGVSNSIGSNTFDILLCLGLPWLVKSWFYPQIPGEHYVQINSTGLGYSAIILFSTLVLLYLSFVLNKFVLDWKIGVSCLAMYIGFLVFAALIELNVFFEVNLPTCDR